MKGFMYLYLQVMIIFIRAVVASDQPSQTAFVLDFDINAF